MAVHWHPELSAFVDEPATMIRVKRRFSDDYRVSVVVEVETDSVGPKVVTVRGGERDCPLALLAEAFGYAREVVSQRGGAT